MYCTCIPVRYKWTIPVKWQSVGSNRNGSLAFDKASAGTKSEHRFHNMENAFILIMYSHLVIFIWKCKQKKLLFYLLFNLLFSAFFFFYQKDSTLVMSTGKIDTIMKVFKKLDAPLLVALKKLN